MDFECIHCGARRYEGESVGLCCKNGAIQLPPLEPLPPALEAVYSSHNNDLRIINGKLALLSMFAEWGLRGSSNTYVPHVTINGQLYSSIPSSLDNQRFQQQYIIDREEASGEGHDAVVEECRQLLLRTHPITADLVMALEIEAPSARVVIDPERRPDEAPRSLYEGSFNDIHILIDDSVIAEPQAIVIHRHQQQNQQQTQRISGVHRFYDTMAFPLLFPRGEEGFSPGIPLNSGRGFVSMERYYLYRIQTRESNYLLRAGRLFQLYVVSAYARVEAYRLLWLRNHQTDLRAASYSTVRDAIVASDNVEGLRLGTRIVLPPSHSGSPRHFHQKFQDAMSIVRKYGAPDYFITFTTNPRWQELEEHPDRPDLLCRVFNVKLKSLLREVIDGKLFGEVAAHFHVVEFQKRGLPHAHILLIMTPETKPRTTADIDRFVAAEIPEDNSILRSLVLQHMIHNKCNPRCQRNGKCVAHFPKQFIDDTHWGQGVYPLYRRRQQPEVPRGRSFTDNRWVVPYNPHLILKYKAHINVEICASVEAVKYVFKYIYKGPDRTVAAVSSNVDEIQQFQDLRSLSSNEAAWRLFQFKLSQRKPAVISLAVHLENQQSLVFQGSAPQALSVPPTTTLTAWMQYNTESSEFHRVLYPDFPEVCVWNSRQKQWKRRENQQRHKTIGRIYTVHPRAGELYYLRMLLQHVPGCTSFADLRNGNETYLAACTALGLLSDDMEWREVMDTAVMTEMCPQIRQLFVELLVFCDVASPVDLFNQFGVRMGDDLFNSIDNFPSSDHVDYDDMVKVLVLKDMERRLLLLGDTQLSHYGLSVTEHQLQLLQNMGTHLQETTSFDSFDVVHEQEEADGCLQNMNTQQKEFCDRIIEEFPTQTPYLHFLDAPGGTGKTYVFNALISKARSQGVGVIAVASSGIASTLLKGGRTFHSTFKPPIRFDRLGDVPVFHIPLQSQLADLIKSVRLILWDEAPMMSARLLEGLDAALQDVCDNQSPFGGKIVVLGGDFRQVLPIVHHGTRPQIVHECHCKSRIWPQFAVSHLTTNMRVQTADDDDAAALSEFCNWLMDVGGGRITTDENDRITIPQQFLLPDKDQLINWVFESIQSGVSEDHLRSAILTPHNKMAHEINHQVLEKIAGPEIVLLSSDTMVDEDNSVIIAPEVLNTHVVAGLPLHKLCLKRGCPVMVLRNLNPAGGICNGTRVKILDIVNNKLLKAEVLMGQHRGAVVLIPRIPLHPPDDMFAYKWTRRQFPVSLCFSMTINKSQGQSLMRVGVYSPKEHEIFGHGQLYVAVSRCTHPSNLRVVASDGKVKNIVYSEVLSSDVPSEDALPRLQSSFTTMSSMPCENIFTTLSSESRSRPPRANIFNLLSRRLKLWYGHNMSLWPPTSINKPGTTFSWLYMPLIMDAFALTGYVHPTPSPFLFARPDGWEDVVSQLYQSMQECELNPNSELWDGPHHLPAARQEEIINAAHGDVLIYMNQLALQHAPLAYHANNQ